MFRVPKVLAARRGDHQQLVRGDFRHLYGALLHPLQEPKGGKNTWGVPMVSFLG